MAQELKVELETIKKTQKEATLEIDNLGKWSGATDASITNKIQDIEERVSGVEDTIKDTDTTVNTKYKKLLTQNIQNSQSP